MSLSLTGQSAARRWSRPFAVALLAVTACSSPPPRDTLPISPAVPSSIAPPPTSGGYYKDDGPGDYPPANLDAIPDAAPRAEPLHRFANRPYAVFGRDYVPATALRPYKERGVASWYGRKFHSQKTSTGETYDMYAMTAAHPTLPLPSYAKVTNVATGQSVVVRVNDRGPFHPGRVIDLSYAAAHRLGIAQRGSGEVEVESIVPDKAPQGTTLAPLPPIAATDDAPAHPMPIGREPAGFVVQLGAFANNANAQGFVSQLSNQTAMPGVEAKVHQSEGLFRVVMGPYATRDDARRAAERLRESLGLDSTVRAQ